MSNRHVLVVGAQRSGKSLFAERLVLGSGLEPVYVATATPGDGEMRRRIAVHRGRRGEGWRTVEEPLHLAETLDVTSSVHAAVLVDCLTLWLSNLMGGDLDPVVAQKGLTDALGRVSGPVVLVSNEVGAGVIPDNPLARAYVDALGTLNQAVATVVGRVVHVVAGQPVIVKPSNAATMKL